MRVNESRLLARIPKEHRLPGLLFLGIEGFLGAVSYGSDSTVKIVAIVGIVAVACVFLFRFFPRPVPRAVEHPTKILTAEQSLSDSLVVTKDVLSRSKDFDHRLWALCQALFDAFKAHSRHFRSFELRILSGMNKEELRHRDLPSDLVLNGFLKMRMDSPSEFLAHADRTDAVGDERMAAPLQAPLLQRQAMIHTAYDSSLLFAIMPGAISRDSVSTLTDGAKRLLAVGVDLGHGDHFDTWDTFLFIVGKEIDTDMENYGHEDYVNVFLLTLDGRFENKSPHKWMDEVLRKLCLGWHPEKRSKSVAIEGE